MISTHDGRFYGTRIWKRKSRDWLVCLPGQADGSKDESKPSNIDWYAR